MLPMNTVVEPATATRSCQNCGQPLLGNHCYACGQPVKGLIRHFGSIVGDFLDSVFEWDSRTVKTIGPLLARPGHLSNEYFAGRRVRYVSPVRLFVFLCIVTFFVLQFVVDTDIRGDAPGRGSIGQAQSIDEAERIRDTTLKALLTSRDAVQGKPRDGIERRMVAFETEADLRIAWLRARDAALAGGTPVPAEPQSTSQPQIHFGSQQWDPDANPLRIAWLPDAFNDWLNQQLARARDNIGRVQQEPRLLVDTFLQTLPQTFFVLLPLFALLLKFAYLFKRRLYMEHLIVALHSHAFLCMMVLLLVALDLVRGLFDTGVVRSTIGWLEVALWAWVPVYLLLMQKRVYAQGWLMTSLKFLVVGACYMLLLATGAAINLMLNLVTL
jgi:hypothetical protein